MPARWQYSPCGRGACSAASTGIDPHLRLFTPPLRRRS